MHTWLVVEAAHAALLPVAVERAWKGSAAVAEVLLPARKGRGALLFAWPEPEPAALRGQPRWPDVLCDWNEIHDDPLFPGAALPVLAEDLSGLGADVLLVHAEPGLAGATIAWYEKGALTLYEHVGSATVAWTEADGLGRPLDASGASTAALAARGLASADRDLFVLDRIDSANRATGEVLLDRAFHRFLAADPPPFDQLAGAVATAPRRLLGGR
jgi:hypothetical protein